MLFLKVDFDAIPAKEKRGRLQLPFSQQGFIFTERYSGAMAFKMAKNQVM